LRDDASEIEHLAVKIAVRRKDLAGDLEQAPALGHLAWEYNKHPLVSAAVQKSSGLLTQLSASVRGWPPAASAIDYPKITQISLEEDMHDATHRYPPSHAQASEGQS